MLLYLSEYISNYYPDFSVFQYITLRVILSMMTALIMSLIIGPRVIKYFSNIGFSENIREDGPKSHSIKEGTPTMGGILILFSLIITTLLWGDLENKYIMYILAVTIIYGGIGFFDDYKKLKTQKGMTVLNKFTLQIIFATIIAIVMYSYIDSPQERILIIPFFKDFYIDLIFWYIPFVVLVIVSTSNAVNITDGLDGLAIMPVVLIAGGLGIFAYLSGNINFSQYLVIPYIKDAGEVTIYIGALIGAGLGFLWFNSYPAQVFMGDVGALSLGAALGLIAIIVRQEIVLIIMGGIFVFEALSVIIQVLSFKYRGRRIFAMAPFHHTLEKLGWAEPKIVVRFWIINVLLVLIALATLKIR